MMTKPAPRGNYIPASLAQHCLNGDAYVPKVFRGEADRNFSGRSLRSPSGRAKFFSTGCNLNSISGVFILEIDCRIYAALSSVPTLKGAYHPCQTTQRSERN